LCLLCFFFSHADLQVNYCNIWRSRQDPAPKGSQRTQHLCLYVVLRIEPGPHTCQASVLPLEPHPQPYTDFLARLCTAVMRAVSQDQITKVLLETLAFENANPEHKHIWGPLKGQNASLSKYVRACAGVGGIEHQSFCFCSSHGWNP
ncbi:hypothetical protein H1C71_035899, partial [Ictidomys tridecemlineatus]